MGTGGYYGFCYNGIYYTVYSQYDSYPSNLGTTILVELIDELTADSSILEEWKERLESNDEWVTFKNKNKLENLLINKGLCNNQIDAQYSYIIDLDGDTFEYWIYGAKALSISLDIESLSKLHKVFKISF